MILDKDLTLKAYERVKEVSKFYQIPEKCLQKPCIANLLAGDEGRSRNRAGLILASELLKNGLDPEEIKRIVLKWNIEALGERSLSDRKLRDIFKSAFKVEGKAKYDFGCNSDLNAYCIPEGKKGCFYYQNYIKDSNKIKEPNYISLRYQHVLTTGEFLMIAYCIPYLEYKRQYRKGSRLYASFREYEAISGINKSHLAKIFKSLSKYGLIEYKPGISRNWEKQASEVRRILPPPEIPKEYAEDLKSLHEYKKLIKKEVVKIG